MEERRKSAHFTIEERMTCEAIIRRYGFHPGKDECHRACVEAIGKPVSKKTLDNWSKEMQTPKPRKRVKPIEGNEVQSGLQNDTEAGVSGHTPAPKIDPIDLSGKSLLELSTTLLRTTLEQLLTGGEAMTDGTRIKVASEAADIMRKLLPQYVIDSLSVLERFQALYDRGVKLNLLRAGNTLSEILGEYAAALEDFLDNHKPTERIDYYDKLQAIWAAAGLDLKKQPEAAAAILNEYELPDEMTIADLLMLDWRTYDACRFPPAKEPTPYVRPYVAPVAPPEPDAELDPIVSIEALSIQESDNSAELDDQPDSIAVALAENELSRQRSKRVTGAITAQQEVRNEIARMKSNGEWWRRRASERRALLTQAGYEINLEDLK